MKPSYYNFIYDFQEDPEKHVFYNARTNALILAPRSGATIIAVIMILARVILVVHTAHAPLVNNRNKKIRIS